MAWLGLGKTTLEDGVAAYLSWHPRAWPVLVRPAKEEASTASPARLHRACTVLGNLNVEEVGATYLSWWTLWRSVMERKHMPAMDEGVHLTRPGNPRTAEASHGTGEHSIPCMAPQDLPGSAEARHDRESAVSLVWLPRAYSALHRAAMEEGLHLLQSTTQYMSSPGDSSQGREERSIPAWLPGPIWV